MLTPDVYPFVLAVFVSILLQRTVQVYVVLLFYPLKGTGETP